MTTQERIEELDSLATEILESDATGEDISDAGTRYLENLEDFFGDDPEAFVSWFRQNVRTA